MDLTVSFEVIANVTSGFNVNHLIGCFFKIRNCSECYLPVQLDSYKLKMCRKIQVNLNVRLAVR